jgi:hypothetical protein
MNKNTTKLLNSFEKSYYCHCAPPHGNKLTIITDEQLKKQFDEWTIGLHVGDTIIEDNEMWLSSQLKRPTRAYCIKGCHSYYAVDLEKEDLYYLGYADTYRLVTEIEELLTVNKKKTIRSFLPEYK